MFDLGPKGTGEFEVKKHNYSHFYEEIMEYYEARLVANKLAELPQIIEINNKCREQWGISIYKGERALWRNSYTANLPGWDIHFNYLQGELKVILLSIVPMDLPFPDSYVMKAEKYTDAFEKLIDNTIQNRMIANFNYVNSKLKLYTCIDYWLNTTRVHSQYILPHKNITYDNLFLFEEYADNIFKKISYVIDKFHEYTKCEINKYIEGERKNV